MVPLSIVDLLLLLFQKPPPPFECRSVRGGGVSGMLWGNGVCLLDTSPKGKAEHFEMKKDMKKDVRAWMVVRMKGMAG